LLSFLAISPNGQNSERREKQTLQPVLILKNFDKGYAEEDYGHCEIRTEFYVLHDAYFNILLPAVRTG